MFSSGVSSGGVYFGGSVVSRPRCVEYFARGEVLQNENIGVHIWEERVVTYGRNGGKRNKVSVFFLHWEGTERRRGDARARNVRESVRDIKIGEHITLGLGGGWGGGGRVRGG